MSLPVDCLNADRLERRPLMPKTNVHWHKKKAFVGHGSCDNVQTERSIFECANWPSWGAHFPEFPENHWGKVPLFFGIWGTV